MDSTPRPSTPVPAVTMGAAAPSGVSVKKNFTIGKLNQDFTYTYKKGGKDKTVKGLKDNWGFIDPQKGVSGFINFKIFGKGGARLSIDTTKYPDIIVYKKEIERTYTFPEGSCVVTKDNKNTYTIGKEDSLSIYGNITNGENIQNVYYFNGLGITEDNLVFQKDADKCKSSVSGGAKPGTTASGPATTAVITPATAPTPSFYSNLVFAPLDTNYTLPDGTIVPVSKEQINQVGLAVKFLYTFKDFRDIMLSYGFTNTGNPDDSVFYYIRNIFNDLSNGKDFPVNYLTEIYKYLTEIYKYLRDDIGKDKSVNILFYIIDTLLNSIRYPLFSSQLKDKLVFNQIKEEICNNAKIGEYPSNPFRLDIFLGPSTNKGSTIYREYINSISPPIPETQLNFYVNALNFQEIIDATCPKKSIINSFDFINDYLIVNFVKLDNEGPNKIIPSPELVFGIRDKFKLIGGLGDNKILYQNVDKIYILDNTTSSKEYSSDPIDVTTGYPLFFLYKRDKEAQIKLVESKKDDVSAYADYDGTISCIDGNTRDKDCITFRRNTAILTKILEPDRSFYQHMISLNVKKDFVITKLNEHIQMSTILEYYRFCNQNDKIQKSTFLQVIQYFIENPIEKKWINPEEFFQLIILSYVQAKGFSKTKYEQILSIKDEDFVRLLLFVGRFLPDKNFYIYYKPFGGKIHYINYLYQILRNPANKGASLSDSFFLILLLGFKILGADFRLPLNQNLGYQSYYEDLFSSAPKIAGKAIIKTVYDRCMFDENNIFNDSGDKTTYDKFVLCLNSLIRNNESQFIDYYEKSSKIMFENVMNGAINNESSEDFKYEEVLVETTINGAYKLSKIPGYTDGLVIIKGDELLYSAFLNKYLGLLTDNHVYAFKNSINEKSYVMFNKRLIIVNDDYLLKTPSLSEAIQFNAEECLKQTVALENYTKLFDKYENVDLNTCIENCSVDAFNMLLDKGFPVTYFTVNKIIYLITIYKDYPIIANNNYSYMLIEALKKCVRIDKFQERTLNSISNATLYKKKEGGGEDTKTSYSTEIITTYRGFNLKRKICNIKSGEIARSIKNLLFSVNIDITKNVEQICFDLNNLFEVIGKGGGKEPKKQSDVAIADTLEDTQPSDNSQNKPKGGSGSEYFKNISYNYVSQVTGLGRDYIKTDKNNYNKDEYKNIDPYLYNPKCMVIYTSLSPKKPESKKDKNKDNINIIGGDDTKKEEKSGGGSKIYIYTPPIFNKILTTRKNADGSDVPEAKLAEIQNTISNLSKMGISPDKILQATDAYKKFNDSDEINNDDTNYHYLTIVRLLQMYGLDIKLLTQISTNKMVNILKHFNLIKSPSDEYFFRNLDRSPIDLETKGKPTGLTIEDELNQQIATFSTYLFYLINSNSKVIIPRIIDLFVTLNY